MDFVQTVYLVSCVKKKRETAAAAKDLYTSSWFRKARAHVEATGMPWFILSAQHGLLDPDQEIEPYEKTLNKMKSSERKEWANKVMAQMEQRLPESEQIIVFAGKKYRDYLMSYLRSKASSVEVPLEKHRQGEQLSWFNERSEQEKTSSVEVPQKGLGIAKELSQFNERVGQEKASSVEVPQKGPPFCARKEHTTT